MTPPYAVGQLKRIARNAASPKLRGRVVSIVGVRGATHFDNTRVVVRLVHDDGSLGDEFLVTPGLLVDL